MKLTLQRHGGVAGIRRPPWSIELTDLPAVSATRISTLLAQATAVPSDQPGATPPDRFSYTLDVEQPGGATRYHFDEVNSHPAWLALADAIRETAEA